MFYISPWMLLGLVLGTVYFVLVLFGFGGTRDENKTGKKSEDKLVSSAKITKDVGEEKEVQTADTKPGEVEWRKELEGRKSDKRKQIGEATFSSCEASDASKPFDGLRLAPADDKKGKKLVAKQSLEAVKIEEVLQSQDALYLQEFSVPEDFIAERQRSRASSHGSENLAEISCENIENIENIEGPGSSEANDAEVTEVKTQALVSSAPFENGFDDIAIRNNEQPTPPSDTLESKESSLFGDFADLLVTKAKKGAFHDIDLESKANYFAEKLSTQIVCDAIGQFATGSVSVDQEIESPNVQELHSFAGSLVDSLIEGASGKVSLVKDVESFAKDMSEQIINEGIEHCAEMEKLKQGRKQKLSLNEMKIFSEGIVSEVVSDGIDEAVGQDVSIRECNSDDKNLQEESAERTTQQAVLSSSLQPHISGIVENLVNGAIYEAALRVKAHSSGPRLENSALEDYAQEILESQVDETVQELIVSALHQAADFEEQEAECDSESFQPNKSKLESQLGSFVDDTVDAAVNEAAGKVLDQQIASNQEQKVLNGHVDLSLETIAEKSTPEIVIKLENEAQVTDLNHGVDVVPSKENEVELGEKGTSETNDYWRRSLILDLEGDEGEFDESFESERSQPSTGGSPLTPVNKETVSDEAESEEFIDSSEDEIIDHAEDAKLGAVGGSNAKKYESDDKMDFEDELGDGDDDDEDDGDTDNDDEGDLLFTGQSMVDGLCVSKPKEKKKKKKKKSALPRPRIQSGKLVINTLDN